MQTPSPTLTEAELRALQRRARSLQRRRQLLLWAPAAALPPAALAALVHPLWGGVIMALGAVLWLLGLNQTIETSDSLHAAIVRKAQQLPPAKRPH